jgi:Family of unknown function (DUF6117)
MAIPAAIKNNFHTLEQAFRNGDIALLECRNRADGESAYAICAVNFISQSGAEPEIELVPFGLMFSSDPYETLIPASDPEFDNLIKKKKMKAGCNARRGKRENRPQGCA